MQNSGPPAMISRSQVIQQSQHRDQNYQGIAIAHCIFQIFRRPSQLRWGASNSLILREEEEEGGRGAQLAF